MQYYPLFLEINLTQNQLGEIALFGIIGIAGIWWQLITFQNDKYKSIPLRVLVPIIIGIIILLGTIIWGELSIHNNQKNLTYDDLQNLVYKEAILFGTFIFKSYLGPIFTVATICMLIYFRIELGEFKLAHWVYIFFEWIFDKMPAWAESIYYVVLVLNVVIGSLIDSHTNIGH